MNILKIIGLLMIVITGTFAGAYASAGLSHRASSLERMERFIEYIGTQIRYTAAPVQVLLAKAASIGEFDSLSFLIAANANVKGGERPDDAWAHAVKQQGEECGFSVSDRELLLHFGEGLGKSDVEGQLSHCEAFHRLFEDRLEAARNDVHIKGKLYMTLGISVGLGAALLLL